MRNSMKVEMEVLGGVIGANSTAAVSFQRPGWRAADLLQGLSAQPAIRIGRIHLPNGQVFASYRRSRRARGDHRPILANTERLLKTAA